MKLTWVLISCLLVASNVEPRTGTDGWREDLSASVSCRAGVATLRWLPQLGPPALYCAFPSNCQTWGWLQTVLGSGVHSQSSPASAAALETNSALCLPRLREPQSPAAHSQLCSRGGVCWDRIARSVCLEGKAPPKRSMSHSWLARHPVICLCFSFFCFYF